MKARRLGLVALALVLTAWVASAEAFVNIGKLKVRADSPPAK